jgi:Zn-dependent peptidase ImmA (M78 family)/DNA-binding XRE family transcriptional regulator
MAEANSSGGRGASRSFNPTRLTFARERAGLTKQGLADKCGVTRRAVTSWEAGEVDGPPTDILAKVLGFPESFFYADDPVRIQEDGVTFRALSSMQARQVGRVLAAASLAIEFSSWMDEHYKTPVPDLPDLSESHALEPSIAAESVRTVWGIHELPVKDMLLLMEKKGVRVFSLPIADREVDALALWREERPFVFLNTARSAERMRFDLAHELGHLILHRQARLRSRNIEQQAHDFAASFLMPADAVYTQVVGELRFDDIFTLKRYWNVSAVAMLHRLWSLSIVSEWHYRSWMIELSKRGYRTSEPGGSHPESSRLFRQLFALARQDGWSVARIASALSMPKGEINEMVFGLAITSAFPEAPPATLFDDAAYGNLRETTLGQSHVMK